MIEGRRQAKVPFNTGQEGLERAGAAASLLIQARAELGAAHVAFRQTQEEVGLRAVSFGDIWECPEGKSAPETVVQQLRAV